MANVEDAIHNQLQNIQTKTGKSLDELFSYIEDSGLQKHGERRALLQQEFSLGYGDANMLALQYNKRSESQSNTDPLDVIYAGNNAVIKPLYEQLIIEIKKLGTFEIAPKKSYCSLRIKKQFLTVGPGSKQRLEIGFNIKDSNVTNLEELPKGGMCQYRTFLTSADEINSQLLENIKVAMNQAE